MHYTNLTDIETVKQRTPLSKQGKLRILHVVGCMNRGGIETWLMHVLRHIDRDRFHIDFLVHTTDVCAYDQEVYALGSRIIPCLDPSQPMLYAHNFQRIVREYGPFDIIHSHVHHFSGYVLRLAKQANIPIRIAHSHNDTSELEGKAGFLRHSYIALMKWLISHYATDGLGCSRKASADLFGSAWERDTRWRVFYCGIDLKNFNQSVDRLSVRNEFGITRDEIAIGHVGRFEPQKNHTFLIEIFAAIAKQEPKARLLLVGDGPLRSQIEQHVNQMGLSDRVIFAGIQNNVARLMLGAMDTFLFPSLHEGLGLALIEAQTASLPCTISDVIPEDADVIRPLVQRISLSQPASVWASAWAKTTLSQPVSNITKADSLAILAGSEFNIEKSVKQLTSIYARAIS